jgi:hypothetical protein
MAFANRQWEEIVGFVEISNTPGLTPGAVGNGTTVAVSAACTLQGTTTPASFALGDILQEVIAPASAALNGIVVFAAPGPTPGTCFVYFQNQTGGSITPVAGSVYKIIAKRYRNDIV